MGLIGETLASLAGIWAIIQALLLFGQWRSDRPYKKWLKRTLDALRTEQKKARRGAIITLEIERFSPEEDFANRAVKEDLLAWHSDLSGHRVCLPFREG